MLDFTQSVRGPMLGEDVALRTGGVPAQRGGEPNRVTTDQVARARLSVARSAVSADDCRQLLDMLGLIDGPDGMPPVCS
jgi:hypothetical protein